ncbi:MAG: SDR family NAD(P)-dependent oxidoreductase [Nostoc sp.]|uniref:SDR family oxidoreductase n=1 Tax=Nostoc sp. TaxID=1180 RepID=UPI002FF2D0B9
MKKILVVGASGFVGKNLAQQLLADGYTVRCLARNPSKVQDLATAGCEIVQGDILDIASIQNAVKYVDAVYISINTLSAQPANKTAKNFVDIELNGLQNIVTACQTHSISRVMFVTFIVAAPDASNELAKDRWKAEQLLLKSGLDVTVIRPGMIVGVGGQGYNSVVANAKRRLAFILGSGKQRFHCITVTDLAYYLVGVLNEPRAFGQCYDVGGDELLTIIEMIDIVAEVLGRNHPRKFHIPLLMLKAISSPIERLMKLPKGAMKAIVDGMRTELVGDSAPIRKILPRPLLSFRQASEKVLL